MPSIFAWKRSSPRKRTPPTPRLTKREKILIEKLQEESLKTVGTSIVIPSAISSSSSATTTTDLEPSATEPDSYFTERQSVKDTKINELEDQIAALLSKNKKLEEEVSLLEEKRCDLNQTCVTLKNQLFSLENIKTNTSLPTFYTGFPNFQTIIALFEFLDPGANGKNINY